MARCHCSLVASLFTCCFIGLPFAILLVYTDSFLGPRHNPKVLIENDSLYESKVGFANFTKRLTPVAYNKAVSKGNNLHCLMGMTQAAAQEANGGASLEAPSYLQAGEIAETEGWVQIDRVPYFLKSLDTALGDLNIPPNLITRTWYNIKYGYIYSNPSNPDINELKGPNGEVC